ncbi:hypothetical protein [Streptomyces dysideae]|uniref:hypothetical protein n=1 Tax=Streptomyces dysideae TaxID=909626 RepID=UPI000A7FBDF8|nr:hypothetical protein [Streptomyces dysideae]
METQQPSSTTLPEPLRTAASALRRVPGAEMVGKAAEGTLDKVGVVSPRGRRIAVYTGAGVLGVAGVVEWPVALTGAAVAWLTQPRPGEKKSTSGASGGTSSGTRAKTSAPRTKKSTSKKSTSKKKTASGRSTSTGRGGSTARRGSTAG